MRNQTNIAHQELRKRIMDGVFHPAESLTEQGLATELGVSRNTIRKALLKLESEALIILEENKSARVRWFSIEEIVQHLEVRELLEGFVVRQSIPLIGTSELEEMRDNLAQMKECRDENDIIKYSKLNWLFHDIVYRVCPNRPAIDMILGIKNQLRRFNIRTVLIPGRCEQSIKEHSSIFSAIERKDGDEAERLMRKHLANVRKVLQKNYQILF